MSATNLLKTAVFHNSPRGVPNNLSSSPPSPQPIFVNKTAEMSEEEFEQYLKREADKFEEMVSGSTKDALQRALQRRDFYFKQAELRSERSRKLNTLKHVKRAANQQTSRINYPIKNRIFEAGVPQNMINIKQQKMNSNTTDAAIYVPAVYFGANLSDRLEKEQKSMQQFFEEQQKKNEIAPNSRPVFLGEDGSVYDMNYRPLFLNKQILEEGRGKLSHLLVKQHKDSFLPQNKKGTASDLDTYEFVYDPELYESSPVPESFSSFEEYEEALVSWAREVQFGLGYTQLPKIIGRHYYRPYTQTSDNDKESTAADSSPTFSPTGPDSPMPNSAPGTPTTSFNHSSSSANLNSPTIAGSPYSTPPRRQRQLSVMPTAAAAEMLLDIEETWETHLFPLEPKPEFYNTFEEYEAALIRWAVISNGIEFVPPHPAQFQNLVGIKMNKLPNYPILGVKTEEVKSGSDRTENAEAQFKENKTKEMRNTGVVKRDFIPTTVRNDWAKLSKANQEVIDMALRKVLDLKITNRQKFGTFARDMYPKIHGTFEEETKLMRKVDYSSLSFRAAEQQRGEYPNSVKEWVYFQRQDRSISKVETEYLFKFQSATGDDYNHQIPLRLLDLSDEETSKERDCPPIVNKKQVQFKIPAFDIGGIAFELLNNPSFVKFLQNLLVGIDHGGRYSDLTECYYPKDFERAQKMVQQLEDLVKNFKVVHPSQVTVDQIKSIFTTDAYLDTFIRFLRKKMPDKVNFYHKGDSQQQTATTYKDLLESALIFVPQLFKVLLNYFEISSSRLIHSKIGAFCFDLMKNKKVDILLDQIVKQIDVTNLYFIAKAITFYDEVPIDIFQYTMEAQGLVAAFLPRDVNTHLINPLFVIYYLDLICVSLVEEDKEYTVYNLLIQQLESSIKGVVEFLNQTNCEFLSKQIWALLGHRNRQVSQVGNFLLNLFFFLSDGFTEMTKILKSPDIQLAENIRRLAQSKFSHVQEAVYRLNPTITNSKWKSLMYNIYGNSDNILADLFQSCHRTQLDLQPPLISRVALHFLTESMDVVSFSKLISASEDDSNMRDEYFAAVDFFSGLVETKTFQRVLSEVTNAVNTKRVHQGILQASMFLSTFAKFAICFEIAKESSSGSAQKPKPKWGGFKTLLVKDKKKANAPVGGTQSASTLARLASSPKGKIEMEINDVKLEISYENLQQIFDLVCSDALSKNKKAYKVRTSILNCFRHLIKVSEIYDMFFKRESNSYQSFYSKLLELCKDGTDMQFNRNCWKLFYQLIKYHASSSMDPLIKTGQMSVFLEMMSSPNSNSSTTTTVMDRTIGSGAEKALQQQQFTSTVMTNALLYFNKVLNLPENTVPKAYRITIGDEESDSQNGEDMQDEFNKKKMEKMLGANKPQADVTKQYEKTVSKLCDYIVSKHMFVIIFMAYQKLKDNYSGWPFQALVSLFATIHNHSICSKLLVSLRKIPEHKDTLQGILELLKGKADGADGMNGNYSVGQDS